MRLFSLILLFSTFPAFSQDCFTTNIPSEGIFNCTGTLYIDTPLIRQNPDDITSLAPLEITASSIVITADIILDGEAGLTATSNTVTGGLAGPGASNGGSIFSGVPTSGGLEDPQDGKVGSDEAGGECGSGAGGGGSYSNAGQSGSQCRITSTVTGLALAGAGGLQATLTLAGGFGGGAGASAGALNSGLGGGGGGAIRIEATSGTITIANGVRLSARGGNGGNATGIGGAGGGGGGGFIYLISPSEISNQGIFDARGGDAGINTTTSFPHGGNGGRGGDGIVRVQIGGNSPEDFPGLQDFSNSTPISTRSSLKSDISCGTIAKNKDDNLLFQMFTGFFAAFLIAFSIRRLLHIGIL